MLRTSVKGFSYMRWLALLLFPITAFAVNLDGSFSGRWDRVHADNNHFIVIGPSFILFNECGMSKMIEYRYTGELNYKSLALTRQEHEVVLEVKRDAEPRCMQAGKHYCTAQVMHWMNNRPQEISLLLSCDDSEFIRVYSRELPTP